MITFKDFILKETPLPDEWDQSIYTQKSSFAKQIQYAKERAKKIGAGSSRVVFSVQYEGRPTALKIAKNKMGLEQNSIEANRSLYQRHPNIVIPLIDYDESNTPPVWVHMEKAKKINKNRFYELTDIPFEWFENIIRYEDNRRNPVDSEDSFFTFDLEYEERVLLKSRNKFLMDVLELVANFDLMGGDIARIQNWGEYKGKAVLIDVGFNSQIMAKKI